MLASGSGGVSACGSGGCLSRGRDGGVHTQADTPPRWPLQRTVRILLECILVFRNFLEDISHFCGATDTPVLDFW